MDSLSTEQIHDLRMALLALKAALMPSKLLDVRHPERKVSVARLEKRIESLTCQLAAGTKLLLPALELLDRFEKAVSSSSRPYQTKLTADYWTEVCRWTDRDSLDAMQLTSGTLNKLISASKFLSLRPLSSVGFEQDRCEGRSDDFSMYVGHAHRQTGKGVRVEVDEIMDAYERVIPYLRNAYCAEMTLCLNTQTESSKSEWREPEEYVDVDRLLELLTLTQRTTSVGLLKIDELAGAVNTPMMIDILARLNAVKALQVPSGRNAEAVDVYFLFACSCWGLMDIRLSVHSAYLASSLSFRRKERKELPVEGIVAFCLAGATDGNHRQITFENGSYAQFTAGIALLQLLIEESQKLEDAVPFSFKISGFDQVDLRPYQSHLHDDVIVIDDLENDLSMTIAVTEQETAAKRGRFEYDEKKKYDMDVSVKQRR